MPHNSTNTPAGKTFKAEDKKKEEKNEVSEGLAKTHEQASDSLTEGTIDKEKNKEK
ncbi:YozQ family protein [Niallia sp. 03133]|uniref:YozQ family protein n=1 Tax=Niallia sp. 03133 TaxID=3458060 RepID=UPI004044CFB3